MKCMALKRNFKKCVAGLLIGLTLFCGYSSTYIQARECQATSMYTALYSLFEYMMASCGLAVTNKADNEVLCDAFCDWFENFGLYRSDAQDKLKYDSILAEFNALTKIVSGRKIVLSEFENLKNAMAEFINRYVKSSSANMSATKDLNVFAESYVSDSSGSRYYVPSAELLKKYGYSPTYAELYNGLSIRRGHLLSYYHKSKGAFTYNEKPYSGEIFVSYYLAYNDWNCDYKKFYPHSNKFYLTDDFVVHSFDTPSTKFNLRAEIFVCDSAEKKIKNVISGLYATDVPLSLQKISDTSVTIFDSAIPSDKQSTFATINSAIGMVTGIYGNVDAISSTIGNISELVAGTTPLIDSIAQSIADLDGKTLTADDINEIVADRIDAIDDIINSVQDDTEDIEQNTATTNSWLSRIYNKIDALSKNVVGSSALQLDDVTEQFKVLDGGGQPDNDDNEPPKIYGIGPFVTVKLLEPLMKGLNIGFTNISKWLSSIRDAIIESINISTQRQIEATQQNTQAVNNILDKIQDFPESIPLEYPDSIPLSIPDNLPNLFPDSIPLELPENFPVSIPLSIPENLPDMFPKSIPLDMPEFPESIPLRLPDFEPFIDLLWDKLLGILVIDPVPIKDIIDDSIEDLDDKFPIKKFRLLLDKFQFDENYDYPIIKMQCPDILAQFLDDSSNLDDNGFLILFDGKDYADTFKFVRKLIGACMWVAYAYAVFCKFKVRFVIS